MIRVNLCGVVGKHFNIISCNKLNSLIKAFYNDGALFVGLWGGYFMKLKRLLSLFLLVLYMVYFIPNEVNTKKVQASQSNGVFEYYNADNTSSYNKYGVKGVVSEGNVLQFDDCIVIVSSSGVYKVKNGISKEYIFINNNYSYNFAGRYENNIYLLAKKIGSEFYENQLLVLNLDSGFFSWDDYSKLIQDKQLVDLVIDNQGNKYFCIVKNYIYVFIKIDTNKNLAASISTYLSKLSDIKILKLKCDRNNNIWFSSYFEGNDTRYHTDSSSILYSIENNSIHTKLYSYGGIRDYYIQDNGHIWFIPEQYGEGLKVSNYINHYDRYGNLIKGYSVNSADSVTADTSGNIWSLDSNGANKLENDKFINKYSTPEYMTKLSINKNGSILVFGESEVILISRNNVEKFKIDSYVRNNAYVTIDNLDNIKIISRDEHKYHNLMMTSINRDGSLKSNSVSILEDFTGVNGQNIKKENNVEGVVIDSEDVNNKYLNSYKTAKVYNDETYVFSGDNEVFQIKGIKPNLYRILEGKIYAIDIKENNNKPQLYAVSKEIKLDGKEVINIFLTSIGEGDSSQDLNPGYTLVQIPSSTPPNENIKYFNLEKFLKDRNNVFYIDVKEIDSKKDYLFKKVDDNYNPSEDLIAHNYSLTYAGVFLDENENIEYVMKSGINNRYRIYRVSYSGNNYSMTIDTRFENQDLEFISQYENIRNLVQAYDGTLFALLDNKIYVRKYGESKFKLLSEIEKANSLVKDRYGKVFIGTDGYGVICYMPQNSKGVDTLHPGVTYMNISKYSKQVPVDSNIEIMFNENLYNGVNYDKITIEDKNGNIVPNSYWINGSVLMIKPEKLLYRSTQYRVTIPYNSLTDKSNRAFSSDYTFNFVTTGETISPTVVKASVDKKSNSVNITISEEIEKGSNFGKIVFTDINGNSIGFNASIDGNMITIKYSNNLVSGTTYRLSIPSSCINDLEGNKMIKGYDLYFVYQ